MDKVAEQTAYVSLKASTFNVKEMDSYISLRV